MNKCFLIEQFFFSPFPLKYLFFLKGRVSFQAVTKNLTMRYVAAAMLVSMAGIVLGL